MTENTPKNKAAFFAQYWQQKVYSNPDLNYVHHLSGFNISLPKDGDYLELTQLSSITDEDAFHVGYKSADHVRDGTVWIQYNADFLRSRGYLIQWRDLTPDQLISYGWVKVKTIIT